MADRTCTIDGCERKYRARGWCATHWSHWRQHGDPLVGDFRPTAGMDTEARFWLKVDRSGDCWLWTACVNEHGYGVLSMGARNELAHRLAYRLLVGPIPSAGLDHACHSRRCVRPGPKHCRPITQKQNMENRRGPQSNGTSGVRGVSWDGRRGKWEAHATHNSRKYHLGYFANIKDAERAAIAGRCRLFTHNELDRAAHA